MNSKFYSIGILVLSCLHITGCKKDPATLEYTLMYKQIYEYENIYQGNLLTRISESEITIGVKYSGTFTDFSEDIFFYDNRDSLVKKESYQINTDGEKIMKALELYSDSTF